MLLDMGFDDVDLAKHHDEHGKPTGGLTLEFLSIMILLQMRLAS